MNNAIEQQRVIEEINTYFDPNPVPLNEDGTIARVVRFVSSYVLRNNTKHVLSELKRLKLMLSGGAINSIFTGKTVNDLDFYMKDPSLKNEADAFLKRFFTEKPFESKNAITYRRQSKRSRKVWSAQLITRFHGTPQEILDTFDFTITQGLYDFENEEFVFGDRFFQDIAAKKLVYLGKSHFPICAMYRTKKYQERGYTLPGSTIMHIALSIVRLDIKTYKELKEQLMGIDTMYLQNLLNSSKYDDALPVDYGQFLVDAFDSIDGVAHAVEDFQPIWEESISPIS